MHFTCYNSPKNPGKWCYAWCYSLCYMCYALTFLLHAFAWPSHLPNIDFTTKLSENSKCK